MTKKIRLLILLFVTIQGLHAQDATSMKYMNQMDSGKIRINLIQLASDDFGGRGSGESGGEKAQTYIADYLSAIGVKPGNKTSYFQNIDAHKSVSNARKQFLINGSDFKNDYRYSNEPSQDTLINSNEILFVGYGIKSSLYDDFGMRDIKNKVVMMLNGKPQDKYGRNYAIDSNDDYLMAQKPKAVITISQDFGTYSTYSYDRLSFSQDFGNSTYSKIEVNERLANKLLESSGKTVKGIVYEIQQTGIPVSLTLSNNVEVLGNTRYNGSEINNVIGIVEGGDLKNEYIVLSAHHDHDGTNYGRIYNGADDNASGVSSLMEIARLMAKAKKEGKGPRRSVVFLFPAAEEKGLYGSDYYVKNPIFALKDTKACVNIDMVGRIGTKYEDAKDNHYVYVVNDKSYSGDLIERTEKINGQSLQLKLDYAHTSPGDSEHYFSRSDQYNFAKNNIPAIMLTSGDHKDYHKETDDTGFIDFNGLYKRSCLAFLLAWDLANDGTIKTLETKK